MTIVWLGISMALAALTVAAPLRWAAAIVIFCIPFSGTAAVMMGDNPLLLPLVVSLGFLSRHSFSLLIRRHRAEFLNLLRSDVPLLALLIYAVVSGMLFPRFFEGMTYVTTQKTAALAPLGPWLISPPQIAYLIFGGWVYLALRHAILRVGLAPVLYGVLAQVVFIGGFGMLQGLLGFVGVYLPTDWIITNSGYVVLAGSVEDGFVRITSVFVESSAFAQWGSGALGFCYALYINRIHPALSLTLTAMIGAALILSTSSTAYFGVACVAMLAVVHAVLDPDRGRRDRAFLILAAGGLMATAALIVVFSADSGFLGELRHMILSMTVEKGQSDSSIQRSSWVQQSIQNAKDTWYFGAGYGTARSSGLFATLFGVIGAPGLLLVILVFGRAALRSFRKLRTGEDAVAAAAGFGLVGCLAAMGLSGADMGLANMLWVFAAVAAAPLAERAAARAANIEHMLDVRGARRSA